MPQPHPEILFPQDNGVLITTHRPTPDTSKEHGYVEEDVLWATGYRDPPRGMALGSSYSALTESESAMVLLRLLTITEAKVTRLQDKLWFDFRGRVSLCCFGWPGTYCADQAGLFCLPSAATAPC